MHRWTRLASLLTALVLGACSTPPGQVSSSGSDTVETSSTSNETPTGPGTTVGNTMGTMGGSGVETLGSTESADSTASESADVTTMGVDPTTMGESTTEMPLPECQNPGDCGSNEDCSPMGQCVSVCEAWGPGHYDYCVTELGTFNSPVLCGEAFSCVVGGNPVATAVCGLTCGSVCECPEPPSTGTATVTCGTVGGGGTNRCHLSCANGETCPDDMVCRNKSYCTHPVRPLAMYGDCGSIAAPCADGGTCATASGGGTTWSVCVSVCPGGVNDCDPAPPGATQGQDCGSVVFPPEGPECHLDCNVGSDCPGNMVCISFDGTPTLCMWP